MNIKEAFTYTGNFDFQLYYVLLFNKVPNVYKYNVKDELERQASELKLSYIQDLFTNIVDFRDRTAIIEPIESTVPAMTRELYWKTLINESGDSKSLVVAADDMVLYIDSTEVSILYKDRELEEIAELAKTIFYRFPEKTIEEKKAKVSLIKVYQGDYYTNEKDIKPTIINIDENYNDDFKPVYEDTIKFLNERSSGLILYWGESGSGKTSLIRHLCSVCPKEYIIVPNSIACRLGDPDLVSFITDHTDSVFILEDCEQLLEDRGENPFNNAISTILNMADGLLSDICNIKFICTFNAPISKIDAALLRKGRCAAKYEFGKLCKEKVAVLNEKYNLGHTVIEDMTLAEVYNADKTDYTEKEGEIKIGF